MGMRYGGNGTFDLKMANVTIVSNLGCDSSDYAAVTPQSIALIQRGGSCTFYNKGAFLPLLSLVDAETGLLQQSLRKTQMRRQSSSTTPSARPQSRRLGSSTQLGCLVRLCPALITSLLLLPIVSWEGPIHYSLSNAAGDPIVQIPSLGVSYSVGTTLISLSGTVCVFVRLRASSHHIAGSP